VLLVSVPFHGMFGIIRALDQGLGGERADLGDIDQQIEELGVVEPAGRWAPSP